MTLTRQAQVVHVGKGFASRMQTMRAEGGSEAGPAQTKRKSIPELYLRVLNTIGGSAGPSFDRLDDLPGLDLTVPIGTPPALFSGDRNLVMPADFGTDGYVCVEQAQPLPMTLVSMTGRATVND